MADQDTGVVLAVGLNDATFQPAPDGCASAATARGAIELLRMLRFDLVVTADQLPDMPVFTFIRKMRAAWPWQKWALVTNRLTNRDEITARTLGVMSILEGALDWDAVAHLADTLRAQEQITQEMVARSSAKALRHAGSAG
jgi:DNA-binding NarL/FixJ family response regulator